MMKTNYLTAVVLGLLTALTGCQAEDDAPHTPQGNIPVGFSGDVPGTRATKEYESAADLTDIGVFAYFTNGAFSEGSSTPNFMYNQQVERQSDGSWTYSPVKYWPGNTTDKISFFAYAPYVDEAATGGSNPSFKSSTATGFPTLAYTVPAAEADQIDLLAATPLMNQTYEGASGCVKFSMQHALTKVSFSVKSEVGLKVTALAVNNAPATAKLTFTDSGFSWDSYTGTKTVNATLAGGGTEVTANATDATAIATFFLLPNKPSSGKLSITYTQHGSSEIQLTKNDITFPSTPAAWQPGGSVNYTLNVKKDGTVAISGGVWTPTPGGDISGKEKGISTAAEWVAFAKLWNANGLPTLPGGTTPDYTLYEDYGWYETNGANRVFTIKLTASFVLTGTNTGELYEPVGTDTHPLTLPIDGQGWQISIDLQNSNQKINGTYSGIVGYTKSGIRNLRVITVPGNSATTGYSIESSGATYAGVLAGRVDGDILNCSAELIKTTVVNTNTSATGAMYLGGLAGYCNGNILNSAVYDDASSPSIISFSNASAGSGLGGLVGGMASGKRVSNCYVRLSQLSEQGGTNAPTAGWLVGSKTGVSFSTCHYMSGNTTNCTPDDSSAGISTFTDYTGLCVLLNTEVEKYTEWARWKETKDETDAVKSVELDLYR